MEQIVFIEFSARFYTRKNRLLGQRSLMLATDSKKPAFGQIFALVAISFFVIGVWSHILLFSEEKDRRLD